MFVIPADEAHEIGGVATTRRIGVGLHTYGGRTPFVHAVCDGLLFDTASGRVVRRYRAVAHRDVPTNLSLSANWNYDEGRLAAIRKELKTVSEIAGRQFVGLLAEEPPRRP